MNKIVLFGAGKIGRSFTGQLFSRSGFEVVFVDISEPVIRELNRRNEYDVVIKSDKPDVVLKIKNVRGILCTDHVKVAEEIADSDIVSVSVGQKGLPGAIESITEGLLLRRKISGDRPLDIILAENLRNADKFVREILLKKLGEDYPVDRLVGLIETSIGKMVPIMHREDQEKDPLLVFAEPYNTLIVDKKAFRNPIPAVEGLAPKENIKAWVDRKSHIHNFGHAAAVYKGFRDYPSVTLLADLLEIPSVKDFTRKAMLQSADILQKKYPGEFTETDLTCHIDDLLSRFRNSALGDTVFRVGCDLKRKLHRNDRVLGPMIDGTALNLPVEYILQTFINGLGFSAADENGNQLPDDIEFSGILHKKSLEYVLLNICRLDRTHDKIIIERILESARSLYM